MAADADPEVLPVAPSDPGQSAAQVAVMMDMARHLHAEQQALAERLEAKVRGQLTAGGAFFAVVQAAAVNLLGSGRASGFEALVVIVAAAVAAVGMVVALVLSVGVWRTTKEKVVLPEKLRTKYLPFAYDGHPLTGHRMVTLLLQSTEARGVTNQDRAKVVNRVAVAVLVTVAVAFVELALSLAFVA